MICLPDKNLPIPTCSCEHSSQLAVDRVVHLWGKLYNTQSLLAFEFDIKIILIGWKGCRSHRWVWRLLSESRLAEKILLRLLWLGLKKRTHFYNLSSRNNFKLAIPNHFKVTVAGNGLKIHPNTQPLASFRCFEHVI